MATKNSLVAPLLRGLVPLAVLAIAGLCPAPINDSAHAPKPVPERSQAELGLEMTYNGAYDTVGRVPRKTDDRGPLRDAPERPDAKSVATASSGIVNRDDGAIVRATETAKNAEQSGGLPVWLMVLIAVGGAAGVLFGLRSWADRTLPVRAR